MDNNVLSHSLPSFVNIALQSLKAGFFNIQYSALEFNPPSVKANTCIPAYTSCHNWKFTIGKWNFAPMRNISVFKYRLSNCQGLQIARPCGTMGSARGFNPFPLTTWILYHTVGIISRCNVAQKYYPNYVHFELLGIETRTLFRFCLIMFVF